MREIPTPLEGVMGALSWQCVLQHFWRAFRKFTPSEGVVEMREIPTPSEGVSDRGRAFVLLLLCNGSKCRDSLPLR